MHLYKALSFWNLSLQVSLFWLVVLGRLRAWKRSGWHANCKWTSSTWSGRRRKHSSSTNVGAFLSVNSSIARRPEDPKDKEQSKDSSKQEEASPSWKQMLASHRAVWHHSTHYWCNDIWLFNNHLTNYRKHKCYQKKSGYTLKHPT